MVVAVDTAVVITMEMDIVIKNMEFNLIFEVSDNSDDFGHGYGNGNGDFDEGGNRGGDGGGYDNGCGFGDASLFMDGRGKYILIEEEK